MSGIFGIFNLDGAPVKPESLQAMQNAMAGWGLDKTSVWSSGPAGLGCLLTFDTPEATQETLPRQSSRSQVLLTAEARLDQRPELCQRLQIPDSEARTMPDGELILRAYEKWGRDCPDHLIGDWSFAAWHPSEKKLFLARDHAGNTALYYYRDAHCFAFASARQALLALKFPRHLNELYLAQLLVSWPAYHGPDTIELDFHRLPPAHALQVSAHDFQTWRYWILENTPELHLNDSREYADGLLEVFRRAVRDRLRAHRRVAVTLSGGLDSGSTAVLAAHELGGIGQRLLAFTSVPAHATEPSIPSGRFGNEWELAHATAEFSGNMDLISDPAEEFNPMDGIRSGLEILAEPAFAAGNLYWIFSIYQRAQQSGAGVLLTGQGGNATISWSGTRTFFNLARAGKWKHLIARRIPVGLLRAYRLTFRQGAMTWTNTAIHPDFAGRLKLAQRLAEATGGVDAADAWSPALLRRTALILPGRSCLGAIHAAMGSAFGLDVRDGTFDKRVLEYCYSVPDREYRGPDGMDRWLIRSAMQGWLPEEVRLNRQRGWQAADLCQRLLDASPQVELALEEIRASKMAREYLSLERIRSVWQAIRQSIDQKTAHDAITILTRGMMAGLYLAGLEKAGGG